MQPPWWFVATIAPGIAVFLGGVALLAARRMNFDNPWADIGWPLMIGGGGYLVVIGLFYIRWLRIPAYVDHRGRRWTRREIDHLPAAEFRKLCEENRDLIDWWEEKRPGLHRPVM